MKRVLAFALACALPAVAAAVVETAPFDLGLAYTVDLPPDYDSTRSYPLIVALHGLGDRMSAYQGTAQLLCPEGAIGLYPESPYPMFSPDGAKLGWAWTLWGDSLATMSSESTAATSSRWVLAAIERVGQRYPVDRHAIFLFGFSQGGMLTYRVGLARPDLFRGLLPAGGWLELPPGALAGLAPAARRLPIRALHGFYDDVVEFRSDQAAIDSLERYGVQAELLRYPVKHQLTSEIFDDARDFVWRELNRERAKPLAMLLEPSGIATPEEKAAALQWVLCATEPLVDIETGLVGLYRADTSVPVRSEVIYLLGARRCLGAESLLTRVLAGRTEPPALRQAAYTALVKLATPSAWRTAEHTERELAITEVVPDGQGAGAGLHAGDVVLRYANRRITTNAELRAAINAVKPGTKQVVMVIRRDGSAVKVKLAPGRIGIRLAEQVR